MNRIESVIISATILIMMFSCNKTTCDSTPIIGNCCVDSSLISDSAFILQCLILYMDLMVIVMVVRCATFSSGVTSYLAGECWD